MKKDDRHVIVAMLELKRTVYGPATGPLGEWLVNRARKLWPRWTGYAWFRKTNVKRNWTIISFHHLANLCWSWSISFGFGRWNACGWVWPWKWFKPMRYGQMHFAVPFLFGISFHRQSYDDMLSRAGEERLREYALSGEDLVA